MFQKYCHEMKNNEKNNNNQTTTTTLKITKIYHKTTYAKRSTTYTKHEKTFSLRFILPERQSGETAFDQFSPFSRAVPWFTFWFWRKRPFNSLQMNFLNKSDAAVISLILKVTPGLSFFFLVLVSGLWIIIQNEIGL